ncbi:hypothetical protein ACPRNU_03890 [Chromobacterium vaccinii]|uniref:hypothetical protein n=1 Tax=Chromobacterium TaxID=535 RepID=UPI0013052BE3|nr:hypothetical protein [Chromobacterium sp. ATCC 53434]
MAGKSFILAVGALAALLVFALFPSPSLALHCHPGGLLLRATLGALQLRLQLNLGGGL